jgi:hypothetical protein
MHRLKTLPGKADRGEDFHDSGLHRTQEQVSFLWINTRRAFKEMPPKRENQNLTKCGLHIEENISSASMDGTQLQLCTPRYFNGMRRTSHAFDSSHMMSETGIIREYSCLAAWHDLGPFIQFEVPFRLFG